MKSFLGVFLAAVVHLWAEEPPNAVDHAGLIQSWDEQSLKSGERIYKSLCTNCHGADGVTPPLPTARAFGKGELKFGKDPYSMFKTLTDGNGMMGPQTWMTPKERYEVIYYIREQFMKPMRKDFVEINDGYLEELPT
ncbi:MAG: c-type cytochrome, partial [Akkermansiaceae bacterium]